MLLICQKVYFYQDVFPGTSLFQLSWVGSLGMAVQTVIGPLTGRLSDKIGQQIMCFIGGAFVCAGYICASFSTAYWHLLVTQGFMYGVGAGFLYFAMVTLPSQFFFRHRGMAIGIAVAGAGEQVPQAADRTRI
jgi:MFS family permease